MKKITFLLAGSVLLLTGCAGVKSSFDCDATTSDTCMTMTKANQLARDKAAKQAGKPAAGGLPSLVNLPATSAAVLPSASRYAVSTSYWLAFRDVGLAWWQLNILFTFAVVMQVALFLQSATARNGVAAFTALMGYIPFSSASYGIPGLLMLAGALLVWQVRDTLRPALFAVWLLLVALLNARHGDVMMFSGVILTLTVLFCVHGLVPASGRRLQAGRWFAPAYAIHLFFIGFLVRVL